MTSEERAQALTRIAGLLGQMSDRGRWWIEQVAIEQVRAERRAEEQRRVREERTHVC